MEREKSGLETTICVNTECPISGNSIDPENCEYTRLYNNMKIGFCSADCPSEWDELSDDEKDARLQGIVPAKEEASSEESEGFESTEGEQSEQQIE